MKYSLHSWLSALVIRNDNHLIITHQPVSMPWPNYDQLWFLIENFKQHTIRLTLYNNILIYYTSLLARVSCLNSSRHVSTLPYSPYSTNSSKQKNLKCTQNEPKTTSSIHFGLMSSLPSSPNTTGSQTTPTSAYNHIIVHSRSKLV